MFKVRIVYHLINFHPDLTIVNAKAINRESLQTFSGFQLFRYAFIQNALELEDAIYTAHLRDRLVINWISAMQ